MLHRRAHVVILCVTAHLVEKLAKVRLSGGLSIVRCIGSHSARVGWRFLARHTLSPWQCRASMPASTGSKPLSMNGLRDSRKFHGGFELDWRK